jgi:hypothetical protein
MGRKPAAVKRIVMKVPITFQEQIDELASARKMSAQKFLEHVEVSYKEDKE